MTEVALFITCLADTFYPRIGEATVRVLRHFGCRVHFPEKQTCCGQPAFNSGFQHEAACALRRLPPLFEEYEHVVCPSASCASMIRHHGPALIETERGDAAAIRGLAERTCEVCTFLRDQLGVDIAEYLRIDGPATFHYPCHARDFYGLDELKVWLAGVPDLRVPGREDLCCGFGGMFSVDFPELSGSMLGDKLDVLSATGAELVVCNEPGCMLQMSGGANRRKLPLRFKHLVELLAESLGLMEPVA